ncbi:receptor-like protein kinase 3 precursor [Solanum lycopersicum]|uniref:Receptor-like protein kinase 3 n=1 Tax=Solanum lycopersicum TaxID=4081 RepID=Q9AUC3_SOLLC|nr:receptor-like protein kinase 3 precursor [Solanum lycopersicum]AAK28345.1 receptor-like protein kinase 3 [Solanum lycopersicum]
MAAHVLIVLFVFFSITSCVSIGDDQVLVEFKELLLNTSLLDSSWKKGTNPCDNNNKWFGVQCDNNNNNVIQALLLGGIGLSGNLDVDVLISLQGLRVVNLSNNSFSGSIPEFFRLGALKSLFIDGNQFSGDIPPDFFSKMASLWKIWFSRNKFSGKIPESLASLKYLLELHLENNEFTGTIPSLSQPNLATINLSNNKLQGLIPQSLSKFGSNPFQGNPDLCGNQIGRECKAVIYGEKSESSGSTKWIIVGLVVVLLLVAILFKSKRKDDQFEKLEKENLDEAVKVHLNKRSMSTRTSMRSSRKGRSRSGSDMGDLVVVNDEKGIFGMPDLMKAAAEVLGNGGLGSAYKALLGNGVLSVVVKRLRETNKFNKECFDAEIRRLARIRHKNILQPLAYHYGKEEKLVVSEYIPKGSLLYLFHGDRGTAHAQLNWCIRVKIILGVANGMKFLHSEFGSYDVPHGNLKSSNILLSANNEPLLTDYAFYPLVNNSQAVQSLFAYKSPEAILNQQVTPKSDVYCLGIIILEILTGKFPSQYLSNQKFTGTDVAQWVQSAIEENRVSELIDPEIETEKDSLEMMEKFLYIGAACTESDHDHRIDMKEAIRRIEEITDLM